VRRTYALLLTVAGQVALAALAPAVAAVPAFASFLVAGLILVRPQ